MNKRNGFVFIHGAGLGTYIWKELSSHLSAPVLEIEFPNREMGDKANQKTSFEAYLNSAIQQIEDWGMDEFTMVVHSIGGCLGMKLYDHFQEKVHGFIAISAIIPQNGQSFTDSFPFPQKIILPFLLRILGTKPPEKMIRNELCNDVSTSQAEEVLQRFSPESLKLYTSKIHYSAVPQESLYIQLTNDKAITQEMQDEMIQNLGSPMVVQLDSGHLPMMSKPQKLTGIILNYVEGKKNDPHIPFSVKK